MKFYVLVSLFVLFCSDSFSQNDTSTFLEDFNFIIHLANNKLFDEAEKERDYLFKKNNLSQLYKDSINYFLGMAYFKDQQLDKSKYFFRKISDVPFFYYKSVYLASIIEAEQNHLDTSYSIVNSIEESTNNDLNELKLFEQIGIQLLKRNYKLFDSLSTNSLFKNQLLQIEHSNLKNYYAIDKKIKRKSPLVAGLLSAVIPGMGKIYAGNNGQGLASFLSCSLFGVVAFENSVRLGYTHPQTLFFMGVFGAFYIGNIWGSALSVQAVKNEKQLENKYNILVSLKLPVSKFFN